MGGKQKTKECRLRQLHYSRQEVTTLTKVVSLSWREVKRLRQTEKEIKNNDLVSGLNNWKIRVPND